MKANELMIGDWVRCTDPKPFQLKIIDEIDHVACGEDCLMVDIADLQPIPLTAEILEKNGFKVRSRYIWEQRYNYCCVKVNIAPKIEIEGEIFDESPILLQVDGAIFSLDVIVDFVHELQHALRLCGIEKEVVL